MYQSDQDGVVRGLGWRIVGVVVGIAAAAAVAFTAVWLQGRSRGADSADMPATSAVARHDRSPAPSASSNPNEAVVVRAPDAAHTKSVNQPAEPREPLADPYRGQSAKLDGKLSRSIGTPQTGHLEGGVQLLGQKWAGLRFLDPTRRRGFTVTTAEVAQLLRDVGRAVSRAFPGSQLALGNLSRPGGGDIGQSTSHNSGRDADIAFFARDAANNDAVMPRMLHFDDSGRAHRADGGQLRFDVARNWAVVRHLLSHPAVVVQWIFVAAPLRNMLLDHALRLGEPELLQERARRVMVQPSDSSRHDDHFHVRIACPPDDRPACINGPGRTTMARDAQIDTLLNMYRHGSPAEQRYARDMLSLPTDGRDLVLPPLESP